jgi:hypothetical protein
MDKAAIPVDFIAWWKRPRFPKPWIKPAIRRRIGDFSNPFEEMDRFKRVRMTAEDGQGGQVGVQCLGKSMNH